MMRIPKVKQHQSLQDLMSSGFRLDTTWEMTEILLL